MFCGSGVQGFGRSGFRDFEIRGFGDSGVLEFRDSGVLGSGIWKFGESVIQGFGDSLGDVLDLNSLRQPCA